MKKFIILIFSSFMFVSCMSSKDKIIGNSQQLQTRSYQTKNFDINKDNLIKASIWALQDLDFVIDKIDVPTGTIMAKKYQNKQILSINLIIRSKDAKSSTIRANANLGLSEVDEMEFYQAFFANISNSIFVLNN